jgi:hypothetical protein
MKSECSCARSQTWASLLGPIHAAFWPRALPRSTAVMHEHTVSLHSRQTSHMACQSHPRQPCACLCAVVAPIYSDVGTFEGLGAHQGSTILCLSGTRASRIHRLTHIPLCICNDRNLGTCRTLVLDWPVVTRPHLPALFLPANLPVCLGASSRCLL